MTERAGFDVECPACHAIFPARRPGRPLRQSTLASVSGPPDVRVPPKNPSIRVVVCEHCDTEFHPARGTKNPRFCSRSCARRNKLARLHGFDRAASA